MQAVRIAKVDDAVGAHRVAAPRQSDVAPRPKRADDPSADGAVPAENQDLHAAQC
jgi:hypothetical protein